MKILINGAGIAGNALAFWLGRLGHTITIVERNKTLRTAGLQLDLRGQGVEVLRLMGLEKRFLDLRVPEQGTQIVDENGKRVVFFPLTQSKDGSQGFTSSWEINRGGLVQLLHDSIKGDVHHRFGTSVSAMEDKGETVQVTYTDGMAETFDLVVGADGAHSKTRKLLLGNTPDVFLHLDNLYVAYFHLPKPIAPGESHVASMYMGTGGRGMMTRRQNDDFVQVYLGCQSTDERLEEIRPGDTKAEVEALSAIMRGAGKQVDEVVEALPSLEDFYLERMGLVKMKRWSSGRVVLLGDAAYCPSAQTGLGTTSALVGAYVLAGEILLYCHDGCANR